MDTLGSKLRSLRKARHMTQVELGNGEVSASLISQIESNRVQPSEAVLHRLCKRLGVSENYFVEYIQSNEHTQLYRRAKNLLEAQQFQDAVTLYQQLIDSESTGLKSVILYMEIGQCYKQLRQFDHATFNLNRAAEVSLQSDDPATAIHTYYQIGNIQRQRNMIEMAKMYWYRAHELLMRHSELHMPISVKVHANLGRAHFILGQYHEAIDSYRIALEEAERLSANLDLAIVCHGLSNVLLHLKDFDGASELTQRAFELYQGLRHDRGMNQCRINLATVLRGQGKYEEALELLTNYLNDPEFYRDPIRHANAMSERALCLMELNEPVEALAEAKQAALMVESDREMWTSLQLVLAKVYLRLNRHHEALNIVEKTAPWTKSTSRAVQEELHEIEVVAHIKLGQLINAVQLAVSGATHSSATRQSRSAAGLPSLSFR